MPNSAKGSATLVLVATPAEVREAAGHAAGYAEVARRGQRLLAAELEERLMAAGASIESLPWRDRAGQPFHWGRWFAPAARDATRRAGAAGRRVEAIGYAGAGAVALLSDDGLATLLGAVPGEAVGNNRFSADAFVVAGDVGQLSLALEALEASATDNAALRHLQAAGVAVRDLGATPFARFDVDTPLDLALLRLAARLPGTRPLGPALESFLEASRLADDRALDVPHLEEIGAVMRDSTAELVVAGRVPASAWAYLETETACRVRCFIEERGMRSARDGRPRSVLAGLLDRSSPAQLVTDLAALGDAVIWDTRVLMAAVGGSAEASAWPPEGERFASDYGDHARIETAWLRELTQAAADASVPFLCGGHALVSDGLHILVDTAWLGR